MTGHQLIQTMMPGQITGFLKRGLLSREVELVLADLATPGSIPRIH